MSAAEKSRQAADYLNVFHDLEGPRVLVRNVAAAPLSGSPAPEPYTRRPARSSFPLVTLRGVLQFYFVLIANDRISLYKCKQLKFVS
jgi:hypothetical protein